MHLILIKMTTDKENKVMPFKIEVQQKFLTNLALLVEISFITQYIQFYKTLIVMVWISLYLKKFAF